MGLIAIFRPTLNLFDHLKETLAALTWEMQVQMPLFCSEFRSKGRRNSKQVCSCIEDPDELSHPAAVADWLCGRRLGSHPTGSPTVLPSTAKDSRCQSSRCDPEPSGSTVTSAQLCSLLHLKLPATSLRLSWLTGGGGLMKRAPGWLAGSPSVMSSRQDWHFNWKLGFMCPGCFLVNAFIGEEGDSGNRAGGCRLLCCDETVTQTYGCNFGCCSMWGARAAAAQAQRPGRSILIPI